MRCQVQLQEQYVLRLDSTHINAFSLYLHILSLHILGTVTYWNIWYQRYTDNTYLEYVTKKLIAEKY